MAWIPPVVRNMNEWVGALLSQHTHEARTWGLLSRGRWVAQNHGLPKGSVDPRPEPAAEPAAPAPEFDSAGTSRIIAATNKSRRNPSDKGQKPKKRARSVVRTLRDETGPDFLVRRVGATPSVAFIPEEDVTIPPLPSAEEGLSAPALQTGGEEVLYPTPLRSIEYVDISGDASSEETPLQRTRRSGQAPAAEADQRAEPVPETEAPMDVGPLPGDETAATSEIPASTEAAPNSPTPVSPTPASRSDNFDDMFSDTPPATELAAGFGHLPIPRVTREASRSTETGARDSLVRIFPAPSVESRRTRSAVITVLEDCNFLSRPVGVASYLRPLVSESDKRKMIGVPWQSLINEGMHAGNRGREAEKFQHLLQVKEDELNRAVALFNLQPELEAAKAENLRLKDELAGMVEKNRLLEADKVGLSQDNARFSSRLGELETTISQLRGELDSVKSDAVNMAERHWLLESESAKYKERMRVFEQKAEDKARICDELKIELEETAEANDLLKAELELDTQSKESLIKREMN
ncbi:uncharacterized protein LOC132063421 [Lycium ferocissimum]|uniref:uncharacterized protein LOC132063421 n=1 Tax=Lycium ferocissimum TaxID=112874 RepID=UPI00281646B8|nr:uncharacterized protein LOC132063421 [Lycium ferocissimum]